MASSFIEIKGFGFWAKDGFVEVMQLCLINEIETRKLDSINWINEYKNELALQSLPMIYGGMSMLLEEFLTTGERKSQIVDLIESIIDKINSTDNYITGSHFQKLRTRSMTILSETGKMKFKNQNEFERIINDSRWNESDGIEKVKGRYQQSFELLKKLIKGDMNSTVSSPQDYWNR